MGGLFLKTAAGQHHHRGGVVVAVLAVWARASIMSTLKAIAFVGAIFWPNAFPFSRHLRFSSTQPCGRTDRQRRMAILASSR